MNSNLYLRDQLAARAKDRGYENIEQGICEMAREEIVAQIKPYVDLKVHIMTFTVKIRNCCPICGYKFEEVSAINICPNCKEESKAEELISEDDDYLWVI